MTGKTSTVCIIVVPCKSTERRGETQLNVLGAVYSFFRTHIH